MSPRRKQRRLRPTVFTFPHKSGHESPKFSTVEQYTIEKPKVTVLSSDTSPVVTFAPEQVAERDERLSIAHTSTYSDVLVDIKSAENKAATEQNSNDIVTGLDEEAPLDVKIYALENAAPTLSEIAKCQTLGEAIEQGQLIAAARAAYGDSLVPFLAPMGRTGDKTVDQAMNELRASRAHCIWISDTHRLFRNVKWRQKKHLNTSTLQWKDDAPDKPIGSREDVIVGLIGQVLAHKRYLDPDGGWEDDEDGIHEHERLFRIMYPGFASNIPISWYDYQIQGGSLIVENARKLADGTTAKLARSFVNKQLGTFCIRSAMFTPQPTDEEEGRASLPARDEGWPIVHFDTAQSLTQIDFHELPKSYRYSTWDLSSATAQTAFMRAIANGYEPQPLEAYDRHNRLIHPNRVPTVLPGAIVIVHCTLERCLYARGSQPSAEWHFYANLVKVQVLKLPTSYDRTMAVKRKFSAGYGPKDPSGSEGQSSKTKKVLQARAVDV
ncbi:hypothetical protein FRC09_006562 [Ceratobasidium sp. 395]|nr:hypothetical protein FRC09_006562 [Ceratobasidium sp. 395]